MPGNRNIARLIGECSPRNMADRQPQVAGCHALYDHYGHPEPRNFDLAKGRAIYNREPKRFGPLSWGRIAAAGSARGARPNQAPLLIVLKNKSSKIRESTNSEGAATDHQQYVARRSQEFVP